MLLSPNYIYNSSQQFWKGIMAKSQLFKFTLYNFLVFLFIVTCNTQG